MLATYRIEHESIDSLTSTEDDHGGATVEGVPCGHQLVTGLEGVGHIGSASRLENKMEDIL